MNPEELIAMLKSLFGVAELSPTAMKNIGEMGAEAPQGMKRLFRGEAMPGAIEGKGQMFTHDPEVAARFAKNTADEPMVNAVDVKDIAADHGNLSEKGVGLRDFGREGVPRKARTDETVFLPKPTAAGKRQIFPAVAPGLATGTMKIVAEEGDKTDDGTPLTPGMRLQDPETGKIIEVIPHIGGQAPTIPAAKGPQELGLSGPRNPFNDVEDSGHGLDMLARMNTSPTIPATDKHEAFTPFGVGAGGSFLDQLEAKLGGRINPAIRGLLTTSTDAPHVLPSSGLKYQMGGEVQESAARGTSPRLTFPAERPNAGNVTPDPMDSAPWSEGKPAFSGEGAPIHSLSHADPAPLDTPNFDVESLKRLGNGSPMAGINPEADPQLPFSPTSAKPGIMASWNNMNPQTKAVIKHLATRGVEGAVLYKLVDMMSAHKGQ